MPIAIPIAMAALNLVSFSNMLFSNNLLDGVERRHQGQPLGDAPRRQHPDDGPPRRPDVLAPRRHGRARRRAPLRDGAPAQPWARLAHEERRRVRRVVVASVQSGVA